MARKTIYVIADPEYEYCIFCTRCFAGLKDEASRYDMNVVKINSVSDLPKEGVETCALFCSEKLWAAQTIRALLQRGIRSVLAGAQPEAFYGVSGTSINRRQIVEDMVQYMILHGRKRLACLGVMPSDVNDAVRAAAFHNAMKSAGLHTDEADVFPVKTNMDDCVLQLLEKAQSYDGVLCVNDQVAVRLITLATAKGVCVPDDLFVSGSGNLLIGQMIRPTLTTTDLNYYQMGRKTVDIWRYLDKSPDASAMTVKVDHKLLSRGSTAYLPFPSAKARPFALDESTDNEADKRNLVVERLENCLYHCDGLDLRILSRVIQGNSMEMISSDLFVSLGTVNYRAKKLYRLMNVTCRRDLQHILSQFPADAKALEEMASAI